jgi:uncharacterized protein YjdB
LDLHLKNRAKNISLVKGTFIGVNITSKDTVITNDQVSWASANPTIASVNDLGFVSGHSAGSTFITISLTKTSSIKIPVTVKPISGKDITLGKNELKMVDGKNSQLYYQQTSNRLIIDSDFKIKWFSENEQIATVDENGTVKAVFPGKTRIGLQVDGTTIYCSVEVLPLPISKIETLPEMTLTEGESGKIHTTITPAYAQGNQLKWSTSSNYVVTVDQVGNIQANKAGTAYIRVQSIDSDRGYSETKVIVKDRTLSLEEVKNADMSFYQKYLNQHYSTLLTPLGDRKPEISVRSELNHINIEIDWNGLSVSPYYLKYSNPEEELKKFGKVLTDQDRIETKRLLREYIRKIAADTFYAYPNKFVTGSFRTSGYKYPYIKAGYWSTSFLTWNNYNGSDGTGNTIRWNPTYDDYNFVLDYDIQSFSYYNPTDGQSYGSSGKPIQIRVGERFNLKLILYPLQNYEEMSYNELGFNLSRLTGTTISVGEDGEITGLAKGTSTVFVYFFPKSKSISVPIEVICKTSS